MKRLLLGLLVIVLAIAGYVFFKFSSSKSGDSGPKQAAITLKKHSSEFNTAVSTAMNSYFSMTDAFVNSDTMAVKANNKKFIALLDSIPMDELKKDTANIYPVAFNFFSNIKANAESLMKQTDITEMRKDFSMISENLYPLFKTINYEGDPMYWENCPMAFGDDNGANWLSKTKEVINPYLGKNHPVYKATMLNCGMVKDTIKAQ